MSIFDGEYYDKISNASKRLAIIVTDYKENEMHWERIEKDKENIKNMLGNLGFENKNINEIHKKEINQISNNTRRFCTFGAFDEDEHNRHDGYIMMFNLTYRKNGNKYRAGESWYTTQDILNNFVVNNLLSWATQPKLIFYQTATYRKPNTQNCNGQSDKQAVEEVDYPIEADIFQSFSNNGNEDSFGNDNGSFYIQSLCEIINQHVNNDTIYDKDLMHIMYEVHARIGKMVGSSVSQTPRFKSTFIKKFKFPSL